MSFAADNGYIPSTITDLMNLVRIGVNTQFSTTYDEETFLGTNFYKYFYALIQRLQENEVKTGEIVLKLQQYFDVTNEVITRPNTTHPGIYDYFQAAGYEISTKPPIDADAGKLYVCVNVDDGAVDYPAKKLELCNLVKDCCVAGVISQGSEVETIALENAQSFDFKFALPNLIPTDLTLTIAISDNNQVNILSDDDIKALLLANIAARYRLGLDFEPQRYFSILDAPWAASVVLTYDIGAGFVSTVYDAAFDDLLTFDIANVTIVTT